MASFDLYLALDSENDITITDSEGNDASSVEVDTGDSITFHCHDHAWGIQFIGEGMPGNSDRKTPPVSPLHFAGKKGDSNGGAFSVVGKVTNGDRWDYVAAIYHHERVYTRDPDIVIKSRG